jgi:hypothetical protein
MDEIGRHVGHMKEKRNAYRMLVGKSKEGDKLEDQNVGGWIILTWILRT